VKNPDFNLLNRIIIGPGYPLRGGISESNQALHNCFIENGQKSKIVSYSLQYPGLLFPGTQQTINLTDDSRNIHDTLNLINTLNPISWIITARWILKQKPHYVIIRYWHPYFAFCLGFIARILRMNSIFIVAWVDNAYPHESMPFQKQLSGFFFKSCNAFLVMSKSVKTQLVQQGNIVDYKIQFSPHPIYNVFGSIIDKKIAQNNIGIPDCSAGNHEKYILFFGLVRAYKGLDLLLEAMALDIIKKRNIKLIIAGEFYDSKERYVKKIHQLNLVDRVILHDYYIDNQNVKNYFCASDIVVQPYLSATQSGVSMIAINFNKPMILTNVGGLSEYVINNVDGYLVDPSPESIALALLDYYDNNREASFVNMLKRKKSLYSWLELANKFDSLYKDLSNV
tara:strand:- start:999 stop:2186 length:1188 start_codon:yes stop_codon:yes gene_type:complete